MSDNGERHSSSSSNLLLTTGSTRGKKRSERYPAKRQIVILDSPGEFSVCVIVSLVFGSLKPACSVPFWAVDLGVLRTHAVPVTQSPQRNVMLLNLGMPSL